MDAGESRQPISESRRRVSNGCSPTCGVVKQVRRWKECLYLDLKGILAWFRYSAGRPYPTADFMTANPKPSAPSTEAQRRAAIKERRENSTFWMAIHLLGSLNLAVVLIITIAGAIAFATVMESKFDSAVARYYIYDAAWFNV